MTPHQQLLAHLDAVYSFAQLVTPDVEEASRLVRDTYDRAFAAVPEAPFADSEQGKAWLFRLLLEERSDHGGHLPPLTERPDEAPDALASRRQAHAAVLVERLLPGALLALPTRTRLLLVLCDVEGLGPRAAAEVLGLTPAAAAARHIDARAELAAHLRKAADPHEADLVEHVMNQPEGLQQAVKSLLARELEPVPPTLRPLIPLPEPARAPATFAEDEQPWVRMLPLVILLVALAGAVTYYLRHRATPFSETNLLELAASDADNVESSVRSQNPAELERYVLDQAGWQLAIPTIDGYRLEGGSVREVTSGVNLPVFIYTGPGPRIVVYAATYHLLDQGTGKIALAADVLQQLEDDRHLDIHDFGAEQAIVWRDRDDLFIAIAKGDAQALVQRIVR